MYAVFDSNSNTRLILVHILVECPLQGCVQGLELVACGDGRQVIDAMPYSSTTIAEP